MLTLEVISSEGSQYDRRVVRPRLLTRVGDETGEGNVEGEQVVTESYVFLHEASLEDREWDFAEFKREKLRRWTRAGYVFEGEYHRVQGDQGRPRHPSSFVKLTKELFRLRPG